MRLPTGRGCGAITMVLGVAAGAGCAVAQLRDADALAPVIGNLPQSTRLVVVSSKPSVVLGELKGPWKRLGPLATGLGSDTLKSWGLLARRLGYEPEEAFGALTSGGVAVVIGEADVAMGADKTSKKETGAHGGVSVRASVDARWAVVSVVKAEVAARVRQRLQAAPHEVIGGRPVLSVEDGRYALVCQKLGDVEGSDEVLALTPTGDRAFLESVVSAVDAARPAGANGAAPGLVGGTQAFAAARNVQADVLVLAAEGDGAKSWERAELVSCSLTGQAWTFEGERFGGDGTAEGTRVERVPAEAAAWYSAWASSASAMFVTGMNEDLRSAATALTPGLTPEGSELKGAGVFVGTSSGGPVSVWCAAKVGGALPADDGLDAMGASLVGMVEEGDWPKTLAAWPMGGAGKPTRPDGVAGGFAMAGPAALRVVSVKIPGSPSLTPGSQGEAMVTPGSVAWFRCGAPEAAGMEKARWLAWGVEPTQDGPAISVRHAELSRLLSSGGVAERAWLTRGVVRPAKVLEALPAPLAFAAGLAGVGAVKEFRVDSWEEGTRPVRSRSLVVLEWTGAK